MKKVIAGLLFLFIAGQSYAQRIVFDPTNYSQNTVTAIKAVASEIRQIEAAIKEAKMLASNLPVVKDIQEAVGTYNELMALKNTAQQLYGQLQQAGNIATTFKSMYGASSARTPTEYLAELARRQQMGDTAVTGLFERANSVNNEIMAISAQHSKLMSSVGNVSGVTEAAQATASALGIVIQQNQGLAQTNAALLQNEGAKLAKQNAEENAADAARAAYLQKMQSAMQRAQQTRTTN